ncbi:pro-cathepsin H-like isoform X2 [Ptychodera flava]|uniref:pro-cathepsin H-like isoform X2 n=1 Tax=Ptychodera flava TaxID=63121 RepID=UPI003969D194
MSLYLLLLVAFFQFVCAGEYHADKPLFELWTQQYNKKYETVEEYRVRFEIWKKNLRMINKHNAGIHSYTLAVNKFADMEFEEFQKKYLLTAPQNCSATQGNHIFHWRDIPKAFDWNKWTRKVVTDVKNQESCGSCWSFSTTGALESHTAIAYSTLISLSEQQLIDCAQAFNNHGCEGGLPSQAFEYIRYNNGLESEADYPYTAKDGKCKFDPSKTVAYVADVVNITLGDEKGILDAVYNHGPVSIAYDVAADFQFYKSGVYSSTECKTSPQHVNHAVLATGFNETVSGEKYWIVKNSWGADWGLHGYFWIKRGENMCGLADCASYPVVHD